MGAKGETAWIDHALRRKHDAVLKCDNDIQISGGSTSLCKYKSIYRLTNFGACSANLLSFMSGVFKGGYSCLQVGCS